MKYFSKICHYRSMESFISFDLEKIIKIRLKLWRVD